MAGDMRPNLDKPETSVVSPAEPDTVGTASGSSGSRGERIAKVGTLISALMASSCCWMPLLLLAVGVSGAGIASALAAYRPVFLVVTFGFLGAAFYFTYRPGRAAAGADCCSTQAVQADCCAPPAGATARQRLNMMALNKVMLWVVTVLAVAFLFSPRYLAAVFDTPNGGITADMDRSVLQVDGMTCQACAAPAAEAIRKVPGVLAVEVDYPKRRATVGTQSGSPVPREQILASLETIGFSGRFE